MRTKMHEHSSSYAVFTIRCRVVVPSTQALYAPGHTVHRQVEFISHQIWPPLPPLTSGATEVTGR